MFASKYYKYCLMITQLLLSVFWMFAAVGCNTTTREQRVAPSDSQEQQKPEPSHKADQPLGPVDKVLELAKSFAIGKDSAEDVQKEFNKLESAQVEVLAEKQDRSFALYMAIGKASSESGSMLGKALDASGSKDSRKNRVSGTALIKELRKAKRPDGEDPAERRKLLFLVLEKYPEQINTLKKADGSFDIAAFNETINVLDAVKAEPLIAKLDATNFEAWVKWASLLANKAAAQPAFSAFLAKASAAKKDEARNALLAEYYGDPVAMKAMIDEAGAWGIKNSLDTDVYVLDSGSSGTRYRGSLLYVLTKRAIRKQGLPGAKGYEAFEELRGFAESIKAQINNLLTYTNHATVADWGVAPLEKIRTILEGALAPTNHENFANYYLALDTPKDVFDAISRPVAQVSNQIVKDLYDKVVGNDPVLAPINAGLLGLQPIGVPGPSFINLLVGRPIDAVGASNYILDSFLLAHGGELGVLNDNRGGDKPIQILAKAARPAGDDATQKARMFGRLLVSDDGTAVTDLTNAELIARVKNFYANAGPGGSGYKDFKTIYEKAHLTVAQKKLMRSTLLAEVFAPTNTKANRTKFLDEIVDPAVDLWGLRGLNAANILADEYDLGLVTGPIIYVVADYAAGLSAAPGVYVPPPGPPPPPGFVPPIMPSPQAEELAVLRNFVLAVKSQDPVGYANHVNVALWSGATIVNMLKGKLEANAIKRREFADYYLALETEENVYNAARRSETKVPNDVLKDLFVKVIGNHDAKANTLANLGAPGQDKIIHYLAKRSVDKDGNLFFMINKILNSVQAVTNVAGEQAIINDHGAGAQPVKMVLDTARIVVDDPAQKLKVISRFFKNANNATMGGVVVADLTAIMPILMNNPPMFKRVYHLFGPATPEARAMRSALLTEAYKNGGIKKLLAEIGDAAGDPWGLNAGFVAGAKDIYDLYLHSGTLLYVLAMQAVDDRGAGKLRAFTRLTEYSLLIQNALGAAQYTNYMAAAESGNTISAHLNNALVAAGRAGETVYTSSYLASATPVDVLNAARNLVLTSEQLKKYYDLIIGNNHSKARLLGVAHAGGTNSFIEELVTKVVDPNIAIILENFLDSIYQDAENTAPGTGPAAELTQLMLNSGGAGVPIKILANPLRPVGDNVVQKTNMFNRLLKNDDGSAVDKLKVADLQAQRFFSGGKFGPATFKRMYDLIAKRDVGKVGAKVHKRTMAMRSALLAEAYPQIADMQKLIEGISVLPSKAVKPTDLKEDIWGLNKGLRTDEYTLNGHTGNLLYVLTEHAIADVAAAAAAGGADLKRYDALRIIAKRIKDDLDDKAEAQKNIDIANGVAQATYDATFLANRYEAFAAAPGGDAKATLDTALLGSMRPAVYYYLLLEQPKVALAPGLFDQSQAVMDAAGTAPPNFDIKVLKWLYDEAITDNQQAFHLGSKGAAGSDKFVHLMVQKDGNDRHHTAVHEILSDFLDKIGKQAGGGATGDAAKELQISALGAGGIDALQVLLNKNHASFELKQVPLIGLLVSVASNATIQGLATDAQAQVMLKAIANEPLLLAKVFPLFDDARMATVASWAGEQTASEDIGKLFAAQFGARSPAVKQGMLDALVKAAITRGPSESPDEPLRTVNQLSDNLFIDDGTLISNRFTPLTAGSVVGPSNLLYVAMEGLADIVPRKVKPFYDLIKTKVGAANWQAYQNDNSWAVTPGHESVFELVARKGIRSENLGIGRWIDGELLDEATVKRVDFSPVKPSNSAVGTSNLLFVALENEDPSKLKVDRFNTNIPYFRKHFATQADWKNYLDYNQRTLVNPNGKSVRELLKEMLEAIGSIPADAATKADLWLKY